MTCPSGWITERVNRLQAKMPSVKFYILLPNDFTQNDINNLKFNNSLNIDFLTIGDLFQQYVEDQGRALNGLVIVTNSYGAVSFVDILLARRGKSVKTAFMRFVENLKRENDF